jgi:Flagellar biosynthesis protein, FliO
MRAGTAAEDGGGGSGDALGRFWAEMGRAFRRTPFGRLKIRRSRRLRVRETISLGERRLVAIVECDEREFLVGATGQTISLLAPLGASAAPANRVRFEEEPALGRAAGAGL